MLWQVSLLSNRCDDQNGKWYVKLLVWERNNEKIYYTTAVSLLFGFVTCFKFPSAKHDYHTSVGTHIIWLCIDLKHPSPKTFSIHRNFNETHYKFTILTFHCWTTLDANSNRLFWSLEISFSFFSFRPFFIIGIAYSSIYVEAFTFSKEKKITIEKKKRWEKIPI